MARERGVQAVARLLAEAAQSDELGTLAAFAPEHLTTTTLFFQYLVFLPLMMRALFGEKLKPLRAEIEPHVRRSVGFFLAACRHGTALGNSPSLAVSALGGGANNRRFFRNAAGRVLPANYSGLCDLVASGRLRTEIVLLQAKGPDPQGRYNFGVSAKRSLIGSPAKGEVPTARRASFS